MEQWKEEEEVAEMGLRGRPPRQPITTATTTITTVTTAYNGVESSNNQELDGNVESDTFLEEYRDTESKDPSFNITNKPQKEQTSHAIDATSSNNDTTIEHESKESRLDRTTELYLDELYKKAVAHEFFCPNCNSCIKKVIVRELASDSAPISDDPVATFRCTSCFSFLIPAGSWIFRNFAPSEEGRRNEQETSNLVQVPPSDTLTNVAPASNIAPSPADKVEFGTIQPHEADKDVVAYPKPDSALKEEVEIDGTSAIDTLRTGEPNADEKQSPKTEVDERLGIQENDKPEKSDGVVKVGLPPSLVVNVDEDVQAIPSEPRDDEKWDILKSIVYGGLTESITSLGVVTSAASADATTLNIVALALANLIGGLFIIGHNLGELKNEQHEGTTDQTSEQVDRYQEILGKRQNFILHATVVVLSFIVFGLVPPVVYGFSFRKSDNKDYKLAAVAAASLLCITILAICKAYVLKPPKNYIKTVLYYAVFGLMASGVSYIAGELIRKLIEQFEWFNSETTVTTPLSEISSGIPKWASY